MGVKRVLTRNFRADGRPASRADYEAGGGYAALRRAIEIGPDAVLKVVLDADLKGRGGAGYPAGKKWAALPPYEKSAKPRLMFVNADEMEPGAFKDRYLIEGDPHQLIEGTIIGGFACRASLGWIFVRGEYVGPLRILEQALAEAREAGYLGKNILGSGWDFELWVHASVGRYMCGEALALLNAMEGERAQPRTKPPYAVDVGAWGRPSIVNNVETFCCVPHIVMNGADWFKGLGKAKDAGTKIYGVSGRVNRPGSFELPMGTTLRELLEEHAGGMREGYRFKAALPGGASTAFLTEAEMDVPLDFTSLGEIHHYLGTGTVIVIDDHTCIVGATGSLQRFFARESCGWCTPCRDGLPWIAEIYGDLEEGRGQPGDIELLEDLCYNIHGKTFCTLALGAMFSIESSLKEFREEYEDHIRLGKCPLRA